jgi:hypothetical protein
MNWISENFEGSYGYCRGKTDICITISWYGKYIFIIPKG